MLEVCFNDSVKGLLKYARNYKPDKKDFVFSLITDKKGVGKLFDVVKAKRENTEKHRKTDEIFQPFLTDSEDIVGISFGLWQGDIREDITSDNSLRKQLIKELFSFDRHGTERDIEKDAEFFWNCCVSDLNRLKSAEDKIRIWVDNLPETLCGLYFTADLLKNTETEIHVVFLPKKLHREDGTTVEYRSWAEIEPGLLSCFSEYEKVLSKEEIDVYATKWQQLRDENAELRVLKNGELASADISYYDDLIRKEFPKEQCKVANIIGSALGKQRLPVSDIFIAKRIQHFIEKGQLIVTDNKNVGFYNTIVAVSK